MLRRCLDSNIVIDFLRGNPCAVSFFKDIESGRIRACISAITLHELYVGAFRSGNPENSLRSVSTVLQYLDVIPVTPVISFISAKYYAMLKSCGRECGISDMLIAASAISENIILITNDKKHFSSVPELKAECLA